MFAQNFKKKRISLQLQKEKQKREKACDRKRKQRERERTKDNQTNNEQKTTNPICTSESKNLFNKRHTIANKEYNSCTSATTNIKANLYFNFVSEEVFIQTTKEFDTLNEQIAYQRCTSCKQVKLELKVDTQTFETDVYQLCSSCKYYSMNDIKQLHLSLPVW